MKDVPRWLAALFLFVLVALPLGGLWFRHSMEHTMLIFSLLVGLELAALFALGMIWQHLAKARYRERFEAEAEARRNETRYRTTLMSVGDGVIVTDAEGRITLLNPIAESLTGWREEEARGRPIEEIFVIVNEDTRKAVRNPVSRVLEEGVVIGLANHTLLITRDGQECPIADSGAPVLDDQGRITGVVLVFRDQTKERRAEAELRRNQRLLERAQEIASIGCWEFDLKEGTVWASQAARHIYGLAKEQWTISAVKNIPLPEYRHALDQEMEGLLQRGETYDIEFRIRRPTDGAILDIRSQAELEPGGQRVIGVLQDITARKRMQEELLQSERYFRIFYEGAPVAYQSLDSDGRLLEVNPKWLQMTGFERDEVCGHSFAEFLRPDQVELFRERFPIFKTRGEVHDVEFDLVRRDGEVINVSVHGRVAYDEQGGFKQTHCVLYNVTDKRKEEEERERLRAQLLQAQKLESVGRLAGGVAHDLNNLLSPILGYGEILLEDLGAGDPHRELVGQIMQAGFRARDLVSQLLAFARKQTLEMQTVNLNTVVAGFAQLLRRTIREDIAIQIAPSPSIPSVRVDVGQVEQIIMNLSVNAQDAMPEGGTITIETGVAEMDESDAESHPDMRAGRYVTLTVRDTGSGMETSVREKIFSPFFTTKEKGKGTGLGLATVYGIIKQHGGNVSVSSEPGRGTIFRIYLPALEEAPAELKGSQMTTELARGTETIMVVEDNDTVRLMTVRLLERQGYKVIAATGGEECLRLLEELVEPIDLLLTDVVMPEMNGKALFERVAARFPGTRVLYMSGYTEDVIADRGILDEGIDFIQKPFSLPTLAGKVREVLERAPRQ